MVNATLVYPTFKGSCSCCGHYKTFLPSGKPAVMPYCEVKVRATDPEETCKNFSLSLGGAF